MYVNNCIITASSTSQQLSHELRCASSQNAATHSSVSTHTDRWCSGSSKHTSQDSLSAIDIYTQYTLVPTSLFEDSSVQNTTIAHHGSNPLTVLSAKWHSHECFEDILTCLCI